MHFRQSNLSLLARLTYVELRFQSGIICKNQHFRICMHYNFLYAVIIHITHHRYGRTHGCNSCRNNRLCHSPLRPFWEEDTVRGINIVRISRHIHPYRIGGEAVSTPTRKVIQGGGLRAHRQRRAAGEDIATAVRPCQHIRPSSPQVRRGACNDDGVKGMAESRHGNYRQLQHLHTVAAGSVGQRVRVFARLRERVAVPEVAVAGRGGQVSGVNMHRDGHRHRVVRGVALGLQATVLRDAVAVAVHRNDEAVEVRENAQGIDRQADFALCAAIDRQALPYRQCADRVAAVCVGKDGDGIGRVEGVVTVIAVGEGENKAVAYHLRGGRRPHRHIGHGVERTTVPVDGGGLLQEVVERPSHHALRVGERRGVVEEILRYGQVLVHVGDVVHVLVPHLAGGRPGDAGRLEDVEVAVICHRRGACHYYLRLSVFVHIRHYGIFNLCVASARIRCKIVWLSDSRSCLMMMQTTVDNA